MIFQIKMIFSKFFHEIRLLTLQILVCFFVTFLVLYLKKVMYVHLTHLILKHKKYFQNYLRDIN